MACDSVAVTSANVTVKLTQEELIAIVKRAVPDALRVEEHMSYTSFYDLPAGQHTYAVAHLQGGDRVILAQTVNGKQVTQQMFFDNGSKTESGRGIARLNTLKATYEQTLTKSLALGNQTAVLKRLQALGKLSNIQEKNAGVVATLTVRA